MLKVKLEFSQFEDRTETEEINIESQELSEGLKLETAGRKYEFNDENGRLVMELYFDTKFPDGQKLKQKVTLKGKKAKMSELQVLDVVNDISIEETNFFLILKLTKISELNQLHGIGNTDKILRKFTNKIIELSKKMGFKLRKLSLSEYGLIFSNNKNSHCIESTIQEINDEIKNFEFDEGMNEGFGCNIGGSLVQEGMEPEDVLQGSYIAIKRSKERGEPIIFSKALGEKIKKEAHEKDKWIGKLKNDLMEQDENKEDGLQLVYQGIASNKTGEIIKYESLLRFFEEGKAISPFFFLKHAEDSGLIEHITKRNIKEVVKKIEETGVQVTTNVSIKDLINENFVVFLKETVPEEIRENITLEILEEEVESEDDFIRNVNRLKKLGFKIAIDDFGSGFSSLERLLKINFDILKIDGSLIKNILKNENNQKIVKIIVEMAKVLGVETVGEFVEDKETFEKLRELGVDYTQGYYFSVPDKELKEDDQEKIDDISKLPKM